MSRKPNTIDKKTYNIYEVAAMLQINLPKAYELAKRTDFPAIRIGRKYVVPIKAFEQWLEQSAIDKQCY